MIGIFMDANRVWEIQNIQARVSSLVTGPPTTAEMRKRPLAPRVTPIRRKGEKIFGGNVLLINCHRGCRMVVVFITNVKF